ncbi:relaxin receptor 1-like isoform X2 [Biomphalaria glabrata]|nr:relaxin receptor 1-like isoform X2 [Biomphalaria glabrata]
MTISLFKNCNVMDASMTNYIKQSKFNFFMILSLPENYLRDRSFQLAHLMLLKSFQEFESYEFYSKLCYRECETQPDSFMIGTFLKSFYEIKYYSGDPFETEVYCGIEQRRYWVSFETFDEVEYILHTLYDRLASTGFTILNALTVIDKSTLLWSSLNPFALKYNFEASYWMVHYLYGHLKIMCFMISSKNYTNRRYGTTLHVDSKTNQTFYIIDINSIRYIDPQLVICECHLHVSDDHITVKTQEKEDTFLKENYISNFFAVLTSPKLSIHLNNCFIYLNHSHHKTTENLYRKYTHPSVKFCENLTTGFLTLLLKKESDLNILRTVNNSDKCRSAKDRLNFIINNNSYNFCIDTDGSHFKATVSIKISLQAFICETGNVGSAYHCIKFNSNSLNCQDNSHLQHCENFSCPHNFVKCYNSYCIPLDMMHDGIRHCPHGEDELVLPRPYTDQCIGTITVFLKDLCLSDQYPHNVKKEQFLCSPKCPEKYTCLSNKRINNNTIASMDIYTFRVPLYNISGTYIPELIAVYFPILNIIELSVQKCHVINFDLSFQTWRFSNLLELDLSYNDLESTGEMKLFHDMRSSRVLNLSNNPSLKINANFTFPESLETIDLSHTSFRSIHGHTFFNLKYLKYLDLSDTEILGFTDLGIPNFYALDTLSIQHVEISKIQQDFFKGLTIRTGLWTSDFKLCCPLILNDNISVDKCHGPTDAISSCKHLIGDIFKRCVIWIVGIITIVGNGTVLIYRFVWNREVFKKAYGLFVTALAISDFLMGIYLMIIASVDIDYKDTYVLDEEHWRNGMLCQISGFLSTLSSETSTFFICLITLDRYLSITYPFGEYKLSKTLTCVLHALAWLVGIILAAVPLINSDWEIYSTNGLCLALPFSAIRFSGWEFNFVVFVGVNFVLFLLIALGQVAIFVNITRRKQTLSCLKQNRIRRLEDLGVAKKLAFVAMSDFMCWFPIGVIGYFSMKGHTFDRDVYAWFAVFVLPINSALNPIIYTIPALYAKCKLNIQNAAQI